jgi:hypothetical protein
VPFGFVLVRVRVRRGAQGALAQERGPGYTLHQHQNLGECINQIWRMEAGIVFGPIHVQGDGVDEALCRPPRLALLSVFLNHPVRRRRRGTMSTASSRATLCFSKPPCTNKNPVKDFCYEGSRWCPVCPVCRAVVDGSLDLAARATSFFI